LIRNVGLPASLLSSKAKVDRAQRKWNDETQASHALRVTSARLNDRAVESFVEAKQLSSRASDHSAPGAFVAALGGLERFWGLALPADSRRTSLGAGPVVERAAVLSLNSLALDWRDRCLRLFDNHLKWNYITGEVDNAVCALGGRWSGEMSEA
jgi:hypothetical protein